MEKQEMIERYFNGELSPGELAELERRVGDDPVFAEEFAFYASAKAAARNLVAEEKKKSFRELYGESGKKSPARVIALAGRRWWYAAAAAVVVFGLLGLYLFVDRGGSPEQMANDYIQKNFQTLGVMMSDQEDSLESIKKVFNKGQYAEALQRAGQLAQKDSTDVEAMKLAGIAALRLADYDQALAYFSRLEEYQGLYANPGKFYHAIALLSRNGQGDKETARGLLEDVVKQGLANKDEAARWLDHW